MRQDGPPFTIGVEEEYLLVDKKTRALIIDPPAELMHKARELLGEQVTAELLRSQIEIGTRVCRNVQQAESELKRLRSGVIAVAAQYGLAPIAASTHPFSRWREQKHTEKDRYQTLALEMQAAARRLVIGGMHVHVGIEGNELRIDLMNQMAYFLPHLLALSCSSPFWEGNDTGLKSYRLTVFDTLPRTGVPERFASWAEYQSHVSLLEDAGLIEDTTRIWWDLRPSAKFPTLETRVMDVCTRLEDAVSLTAILVCILRMFYRLRCANQRWRIYTPMLIRENRWRAMRYSYDAGLLDLAKARVIPFEDLLEEILGLIAEDAEALDCVAEVGNARRILTRGTSAHRQLKTFEIEQAAGANTEDALKAVVDRLIEDTAEGL